MKLGFTYLIPLLLIMLCPACETVIDLDLNEASPALVIEGDLSHPDGLLTVKISKTGSFFKPGTVEMVEDASVYLENKHAKKQKVNHAGKGVYKLDQIHTNPGESFKLYVKVEDEIYSAVSTVKNPVDIDSVSYSYYAGDSFFRPGYRFNVTFTDPPEEKNYYRIKVYRNNYLFNRVNDLVVFDDTDRNGETITVHLHSQYYLDEGEAAVLELMSIDRQAWEYFSSLGEVVKDNPNSPAPANPVTNFTNGALGYFYAWSYHRKTVVIE
jgi:hypothetical protein